CLDGEGLCVTPALRHLGPGTVRDRLGLDRPVPSHERGAVVSRRWLTLPGVGRTLLVRRRASHRLAVLWSWLSGRPLISPEQRQAALLLRLARHAVAAPRVLAMGQRYRSGEVDSFL